MATITAVAAGFTLAPSKARERSYVGYLLEKGEKTVPIDGADYELRPNPEGEYVILLPLRSFGAAKRLGKIFEASCKAHDKAMKERARFGAT